MVHGYLALLWTLLLVGAFWAALIIVAMAFFLLRPRKMTDARALLELNRLTPADLNLPFEEVAFHILDEQTNQKLKITGWWIPNESAQGKCAIIVHGYSDAKIGAIAWAPLLRSLGFAILAVDLRGHGDSDFRVCTAGYWERRDLNQVIDQLRAARGESVAQILLFGISMGAAVAAATAALRDDVSAVILECPYADFAKAAAYQAMRLGMPGPFFQNAAISLAQWIAGCDFSAVRPVELIPELNCPVLVIQACDDPFLSPEDLQAMRKAVESRPAGRGHSIFWPLEGVHHVVGFCEDPAEYRRRIENFIAQALPIPAIVCDK
ncbi:MAG: alpha/beta hydrolase [Planctomycetota bacterium]|nr:alpha/beta hydrolase [Planctomycetota bacterium]